MQSTGCCSSSSSAVVLSSASSTTSDIPALLSARCTAMRSISSSSTIRIVHRSSMHILWKLVDRPILIQGRHRLYKGGEGDRLENIAGHVQVVCLDAVALIVRGG